MSSTATPRRRDFVVGTAGHIDHGKSALVRALTGIDPDRLQEEKERGITIDLGFAHLQLADGLRVGFVDVPGHERFVKNMLAGIGGIDAVLLVVAADESIMPQTREHFDICRLLGVRRGIVAISKCDLVDEELADLVELELRDHLAGTFLETAPMVRTSVATGAGLETLRQELAAVLGAAPRRAADGIARLPVDRVFTIHGFGTVVTGTLLSGRIRAGDALELLPAGRKVTVRGAQVHGEPVQEATAGQRLALNLHGVDVDDLRRGDLLATPQSLALTHLIDARLHVLGGFAAVQRYQRVRFHHGAAELLARVVPLEAEVVAAGGSGLVQLRLESPYAVAPGDRFIVRRYSPMVTLGGGTVLDNLPDKHRAREPQAVARLLRLEGGDARERLLQVVDAAGPGGVAEQRLVQALVTPVAELRRLVESAVGERRLVTVDTDPLYLVTPHHLDDLAAAIGAALNEYHRANPLRPAMPKRELLAGIGKDLPTAVADAAIALLEERGEASVAAEGVALGGHRVELTDQQRGIRDHLLQLFAAAGLAPPSLAEVTASLDAPSQQTRDVVFHLLREGELVRLRDDLVFRRAALDGLVDELRRRVEPGARFGVGDFKDWTGVSRKHAIPLLEHLDQRHVTRRVGDQRELLQH